MDQEVPQDELPDIPEPASPPREHVAPNYHKQSHKLRNILILIVILVLAGGGAYAYLKHKQSQKNAKQAQQLQTAQKTATLKIASTTKTYTSPNFYLTFTYPANWTITDNGGGQMTAVSPATQLKNEANQTVTGQITLLIRQKTQKLNEFNAGNAVALLDSEKITYAQPTPSQRAATYISFLQYVSTGGSGLDGIYITSDNGYQKGQAIPLVDMQQEDPVISLTFSKCNDSSCSGKSTPLTLSATSWSNTSFANPLKTLLESLIIT